MNIRRALVPAVALTACLSTGGFAQTQTTKTEIKVKDGKDVKLVGCVEPGESGKYLLTHVADKKQPRPDYVLVSEDDISKHVGHQVEISGVATDRGDSKVEVKSTTKTDVKDGDDKKVETKAEIKGDLGQLQYLSVKSLKMIAASCR